MDLAHFEFQLGLFALFLGLLLLIWFRVHKHPIYFADD